MLTKTTIAIPRPQVTVEPLGGTCDGGGWFGRRLCAAGVDRHDPVPIRLAGLSLVVDIAGRGADCDVVLGELAGALGPLDPVAEDSGGRFPFDRDAPPAVVRTVCRPDGGRRT